MFVMLLVFGLLELYQDFSKQYKLFNWVFCMFFQTLKTFPSQLNQRTDSKEQFVLGSENSRTRCSLLCQPPDRRLTCATDRVNALQHKPLSAVPWLEQPQYERESTNCQPAAHVWRGLKNSNQGHIYSSHRKRVHAWTCTVTFTRHTSLFCVCLLFLNPTHFTSYHLFV